MPGWNSSNNLKTAEYIVRYDFRLFRLGLGRRSPITGNRSFYDIHHLHLMDVIANHWPTFKGDHKRRERNAKMFFRSFISQKKFKTKKKRR